MRTLALLAGPILLLSAAFAAGDDQKTPSIKEVMAKLHKGAKSPLATVKGQLKSSSPDWDAIQKASKDFAVLGASLAKNDPPRGDGAAWKKLADRYFADAKALDDAAQDKDKSSADAAFRKLSASCKNCHQAHKGQ
jgi:cytochrome c556